MNQDSSADAHFMHPNGQTSNNVSGKKFDQFGEWDLGTRPQLEVLNEINHHGVSVVEVVKTPQGWRVKRDSPLNRRITAQTPVRISGPRASMEHIRSFMAPKWDTSGAMARGTLNNCGHGKTPWGTYLACEENWAFYFQTTSGAALPANDVASRRRYGVASAAPAAGATKAVSQGWHTVSATDDRFARWNLAALGANAPMDFRNEANTFGFNVEIDPLAPNSTPAKRVAMGRFAHEAAVCGVPKAGEPLAFYMGCDSRNEYIYKFVSTAVWDPRDVGGGLAAGDKYLSKVTVKNRMGVNGVEQTGTQETFLGAALGEAKLLRFLVAPKGAEVTGITETADGRTLFVNIQHPGELSKALSTGEAPQSMLPGNHGYGMPGRPRSATIVITRKDGGLIGV